MQKQVVILTREPIVSRVAMMVLDTQGIDTMASWVQEHRPECMPDDYKSKGWSSLFPHDLREHLGRQLTGNEMLVELAGRKCYDSFGLKAGRKSNAEYIQNTQGGDIPHASILYHAKISFFFAGISRRVSHELIRNYVGADRDEEGSPSQESTRFTHHYGFFVCPPRRLGDEKKIEEFREAMQAQYNKYTEYVDDEIAEFVAASESGKKPTGMERKRIYEDASSMLPHASETSFIWTTNPMAVAKLVRERRDHSADLEVQRFANVLRRVAVASDPNLYTQPWMKD